MKGINSKLENNKKNVKEKKNLTPRELEILNYIVIGLKDKEIAKRVGLSIGTIKKDIMNIYRKLNVNNRIKAAIIGVKEFKM